MLRMMTFYAALSLGQQKRPDLLFSNGSGLCFTQLVVPSGAGHLLVVVDTNNTRVHYRCLLMQSKQWTLLYCLYLLTTHLLLLQEMLGSFLRISLLCERSFSTSSPVEPAHDYHRPDDQDNHSDCVHRVSHGSATFPLDQIFTAALTFSA